MDIERAKELLSALADGVDPLTGEVLDRDNVCNKPEIIRALHMAVYELDKCEKKTVKKHLPENAGKPWTEGRRGQALRNVRLPVRQGGSFAGSSNARPGRWRQGWNSWVNCGIVRNSSADKRHAAPSRRRRRPGPGERSVLTDGGRT